MTKQLIPVVVATGLLFLAGCATQSPGSSSAPVGKSSITSTPFGTTLMGEPVTLYTLRNRQGAEAKIASYGGIVTSLKMPDRDGNYGDVVLGYDNLVGYLTNSPYFGCLVGRYGNRIANGKFTLDGVEYTLATNDYPNALHGGVRGFDKRVWKTEPKMTPNGPSLVMNYLSKDGEEGYPGNLNVTAVYTLTERNELRLDYTATTDQATVLNLTHHSYFNLAGRGDILGHEVMLVSDRFTPVDSTLIPTGELRPVEGTPFDFNEPTPIGARINAANQQIEYGGGYDHNWVIKKPRGILGLMARVHEPGTGRVMEVLSTEPGLQFYSGNFLDGTITGKGGWTYQHRNGFCMEPQHYPDSPNKAYFPSTVLRPGDVYQNTIIYRFYAE
jgi:aldose 1-epimerase